MGKAGHRIQGDGDGHGDLCSVLHGFSDEDAFLAARLDVNTCRESNHTLALSEHSVLTNVNMEICCNGNVDKKQHSERKKALACAFACL
jgi:hypothetical protein